MDTPCLPGLIQWLTKHHHAAVERVDTHISTVLLVSKHAYKLKKPLRLPFLDFSTPELRHRFCAEELRINQRTAPNVYLEVLPVVGSVESPSLGASNETLEAIDWVLHMQRFPANAVFDGLAKTHQLQAEQLDALAAHVAAFHRSLPALPPDWKPQKDLDAWALECCDEIEIHSDRPAWLTNERLSALRARLQQTLQELHDWRLQRQTQGHIRECHGDLHLGNVVQWQGQVMAFDAIEFDSDLRCIDVMNDAAFTFMDLHAREMPALAWRFINAYVEHTGDFDGLRGLQLFAAYRALVRAKVALLGGSPPETFNGYWALAERFTTPQRQPMLLVTMGLSGSGKSTVAQLLMETLAQQGVGAVRLRSDVERKRLHHLAPTDRSGEPAVLYSAQATERTYTHLQHTARALLQAGHWVILDATCLKQTQRACLKTAAEQAKADFLLVECQANTEQLRERIRTRQLTNNDASDATLAVLEHQISHAEPLSEDWGNKHHRITNNADLPALRSQVDRLARELSELYRS